eukprot:CCRYP_018193-RB/>CCRYP_018193-RB protein AED:0.04 eAED:0.04 QI:322/1/1/1/0.83/0.85/7/554/1291
MPFLRNKKKATKSHTITDASNNFLDHADSADVTGAGIVDSSGNRPVASKEAKGSKFARKKKLFGAGTGNANVIAETTSRKATDDPQDIPNVRDPETNPSVGPLGANNVTSKGVAVSHQYQRAVPQSRATIKIRQNQDARNQSNATVTSQTITTATTSASTSNTSSVSALFDHSKSSNPSSLQGSTQQDTTCSRGDRSNVVQQRRQQQYQQMPYSKRAPSSNHTSNGPSSLNQGNSRQQQQQHQHNMSKHHAQELSSAFPSDPIPSSTVMGNNTMSGAVAMTRSGWSIISNASTAMNSEHYIESLDDLPSSPGVRSGKAFPVLNSQSDDRIRSALSRPFGRLHLPPTYQQKWTVQVEQPTWDAEEERYKYKINLTRNPTTKNSSRISPSMYHGSLENEPGIMSRQLTSTPTSLNSATTSRSLQDFVWLERALRVEYHGAMLVPLLSLALYFEASSEIGTDGACEDGSVASKSFANMSMVSEGSRRMPLDGNVISQSIGYLEEKMDRNEIVETSILSNWLSDIFNGVRGNGELLLTGRCDAAESEAIETFLFRHTELLKEPSRIGRVGLNPCRASALGSPFNLFSIMGGDREDGCNKSLFVNFLENPFTCFGSSPSFATSKHDKIDSNEAMSLSRMCSSGATGVPGIKSCNSNLSIVSSVGDDFEGFQLSSSIIATHSELLEAERDLIASYIKCSTVAMTKVHCLMKDEAYVGLCWKRFAVCLSNLFSVEKDLETAHIGDQIKSSKRNQPFRKLRKTAVDDGLRILARGKIDRAKPSLSTLRSMLNAYYADLNSVVPAFKEYRDVINHLHELNEMASASSSHPGNWKTRQQKDDDWFSPFDQLRAFTSNIAKQIVGPPPDTTTRTLDSDAASDEEMYSLNTTQSKALQKRVLTNERMLKYTITLLCKACPLRTARMAWWYLKTEAKQASNVHAAATALRQTLSIDADTAIAMKERNYDEVELTDNDAEIELVKRILDLGLSKDDLNVGNYADIEIRRQKALRMAMQRAGRWNAETALAIMEAAGVEDAEVQMDETSRELRHVRKFAISLREHVTRCREAAEGLRLAFIHNAESQMQIARSRREFWGAISTVFSGKILPEEDQQSMDSPSTRVLCSVGIATHDKGGWLGNNDESKNQRRRRCGEAARRYLKKRDYQANILISRVLKLLREYEQRLEGIESFVYMHCVGIQLEKHCSKVRAKALSAWEKRTDISTAINVATKKRIPKLVQELKVKLEALPQVSHTTVIKAKESHLASKTLKSDLHKLANRRFGRAQEVSTERVIAIMSLWAKREF